MRVPSAAAGRLSSSRRAPSLGSSIVGLSVMTGLTLVRLQDLVFAVAKFSIDPKEDR